ncbi:MAG: M3 family metallopeptidase [Myxococcota bacterium]|nr:M3 family metallopeptidase [Myxococcota bacterium]
MQHFVGKVGGMKKDIEQHSNPLLSRTGPIPFDQIEARHVEPAISHLLDAARSSIETIVSNAAPADYANTLGVLERATERLNTAMSWIGHLEELLGREDLRAAKRTIQGEVAAFRSSLRHNTSLWKRLREVSESDQYARLDATRKRCLDETLKDFDRHGAHLPDTAKRRLAEIDVALTEITNQFGQNVVDATDAYVYQVTDETRLRGLPQSAINAARLAAQGRGLDGWCFTLQGPSIVPVLDHLEDRGIREDIYRAYNTRATTGDFDNREALNQILRLRREKADTLGYRDVSDLFLESRMVKNGEAAQAFLDHLRAESETAAEAEHRQLEKFARAQGDAPATLAPWDIAYYAEKLRRQTFDFDAEELRPYFELESVLRGHFELLNRLFGLTVNEEATAVWHDDVRSFALVDEDGIRRGVFYLDLFPRAGKRPGAWMRPLRTSSDPRRGEPHYAVIGANFTPPSETGLALLRHREVETLFHEFGHLLHHLVTTVDVPSMAGTNVAWDFVELPSQIMENWCWERESLDLFARHHQTNACIPAPLFEKMSAARTYRAATQMMRQLSLGTVDLKMHREFMAHDGDSVLNFARQVFQDFSQVELPAWYGMVASFNHLFSHPVGYAAGYYSYKWAEVLDADAFTRFQTEGIFSRDVGMAFKHTILERGNSEDPMALFVDFMGRKPDARALFVRSGLANEG